MAMMENNTCEGLCRETCKGCYYHRPLSACKIDGQHACHYCYDTGLPRAVDADTCGRLRVHYLDKVWTGRNIPVPFNTKRSAQERMKLA